MTDPKKVSESQPRKFEWLEKCKPSDFDGHTSFDALNPSQKLDWLEQAGNVIHDLKGKAHPKGRN